MFTWWVASLISNGAIIFTEYTNRSATGGWASALPYTFLPIMLAQFCLFRAFNGAPNWFMAWIVFTIGNAVMRVAAVQVMAGHEVKSWAFSLLGIAVMIGGSFILKVGLK